ncbi:cupin domain-containing protein [Pontibacter mangrovi]|uniref:Cupin domain-containing protein n=1 Tax=Pontibacter mangrovi TaxID=2589816 RepID=A0A501W3R1_9BACT|nr:cupin domain-containing protein [Pontibacter mangrovi]TPE43265.1 cupin domain-containing protein [Pontibacter mangrovi]
MKKQVEPQQHEELRIFTNLVKLVLTQEQTGGQYAVFEDNVPPLGGPPPHTHPAEEVFYVLSGDFEFVLNDLANPFRATAGSVVHVPSNALHTFKNVGDSAGKLLTIVTPGNLVNYFREIGEPITNEADRPDLTVPPDFSKINPEKAFGLAPRYEIRFHLPDVVA